MPLQRTTYLMASYRTLLSTSFLVIALNSCTQSNSTVAVETSSPLTNTVSASREVGVSPKNALLWSDGFEASNWQQHWGIKNQGEWGLQDAQVIKDPSGSFSKVLRVNYPAGSASPTVSRKYGAPLGGAQFYAALGLTPKDSLRLSYYLRFSENFNFVKGGKLPGLFGGIGNSGGEIPNGTDGFSTRFMWRTNGDGEVYAYLPTSRKYGTSIGRGNWHFQAGKWYHIEQEVLLNQPGKSNGQIQVWLDGKSVLNQGGLTFRTTNNLKINGIFFSTFFGGDDRSWATPKSVYADFANFSVYSVN